MKNAILFVLGLTISSVGMAQLNAMAKAPTVTVKSETILGHRIGPAGQSMLITK
jgi:hypothetical protein